MLATDGLEAASFASGMSWSIRERKYIIIANKQLQCANNIMHGGRLITHHILIIYYKITLNYLNKIQMVFFYLSPCVAIWKQLFPLFLSARNFFAENFRDFHVTAYIKTILSDWRSLILNYNFLKGTWALQRVTHQSLQGIFRRTIPQSRWQILHFYSHFPTPQGCYSGAPYRDFPYFWFF